jgi:saccharopine dehydrogenase (NAD+, L-lysine forming)
MKIGVIRETKTPPDRRVPLTPRQCSELEKKYPELDIIVEPSPMRCYSDDEYRSAGVNVSDDLSECEIMMGVKEVDIPELRPDKSYLFFSHTAKEQPYNRKLLKEIIGKRITLIDYEYLTRQDKSRVVAFGRWAGIVGAYNGLRAFGLRTKSFDLKPAWQINDLDLLKSTLKDIEMGNTRIVLTGGGRVAGGAVEILLEANIREVSPEDYLSKTFSESVFCRLDPWHYTKRKDGAAFDFKHFVKYPDEYENTFVPYASISDMFVACHFWDPESPVFLTVEDMQSDTFPVKVIADISCDIDGPIPSTIKPSTIAEPVYGYNAITREESEYPFSEDVITVMAVDNLPGELPRNASEDFGLALIAHVIPSLIGDDSEGIVERATITKGGALTDIFCYLERYLSEE